ncbi:HTH domain-containing protein [Pediococcus stilesii]|uniref:HTH domain-containing protein n=1 Tax=Pediococcus stilesii TaxID=331679 RepID=A0A5R9BV14_9LACO|nr:helix-turn-helix domain-containing protein [Pediococcus stilesii]TLQ03841.1 HTH domain-containing protein [Pediococcus stilesii]
MDLSERQIKLINYLFDFPEGVKMAQIEKELGASRRTIYRDIAELELLIHPMNLTIENTKHLFKIDGSSKGKKQLHEAIQIEFEEPSMLSIEQRQSAIAVELLSEIEPVKMQSFAIDFHTSVATISKDLVALEATFADYQILIKRQKSKGVGIEGTEFNIRNLLNAIIDSELGIYDFFQILANPEWK